MFLGYVKIFEEAFPSFYILSHPGESLLKSCPGMFKVVTGEALPWSCTEPGVCWDWGFGRKHIEVSTQCMRVPVCVECWSSYIVQYWNLGNLTLFSVTVIPRAWLIVYCITTHIIVLFYFLAHLSYHVRTSSVPVDNLAWWILYHVVVKAAWQSCSSTIPFAMVK